MVSVKADDNSGPNSRERLRGQRVDLRGLEKFAVTIPEPESFSPDEIKALRDQFQISQAVLARLLGTSKAAVTQWEQGLRRPTKTASRILGLVKRKGLEVLL